MKTFQFVGSVIIGIVIFPLVSAIMYGFIVRDIASIFEINALVIIYMMMGVPAIIFSCSLVCLITYYRKNRNPVRQIFETAYFFLIGIVLGAMTFLSAPFFWDSAGTIKELLWIRIIFGAAVGGISILPVLYAGRIFEKLLSNKSL